MKCPAFYLFEWNDPDDGDAIRIDASHIFALGPSAKTVHLRLDEWVGCTLIRIKDALANDQGKLFLIFKNKCGEGVCRECTIQKWVRIRTNSANAVFPTFGVKVTTSLHGREHFGDYESMKAEPLPSAFAVVGPGGPTDQLLFKLDGFSQEGTYLTGYLRHSPENLALANHYKGFPRLTMHWKGRSDPMRRWQARCQIVGVREDRFHGRPHLRILFDTQGHAKWNYGTDSYRLPTIKVNPLSITQSAEQAEQAMRRMGASLNTLRNAFKPIGQMFTIPERVKRGELMEVEASNSNGNRRIWALDYVIVKTDPALDQEPGTGIPLPGGPRGMEITGTIPGVFADTILLDAFNAEKEFQVTLANRAVLVKISSLTLREEMESDGVCEIIMQSCSKPYTCRPVPDPSAFTIKENCLPPPHWAGVSASWVQLDEEHEYPPEGMQHMTDTLAYAKAGMLKNFPHAVSSDGQGGIKMSQEHLKQLEEAMEKQGIIRSKGDSMMGRREALRKWREAHPVVARKLKRPMIRCPEQEAVERLATRRNKKWEAKSAKRLAKKHAKEKKAEAIEARKGAVALAKIAEKRKAIEWKRETKRKLAEGREMRKAHKLASKDGAARRKRADKAYRKAEKHRKRIARERIAENKCLQRPIYARAERARLKQLGKERRFRFYCSKWNPRNWLRTKMFWADCAAKQQQDDELFTRELAKMLKPLTDRLLM